MAGSGIAESILFSAGLVVAITFVGVFAAVVSGAGDDLRQQGHRVSDGLTTDIVLLNDPGSVAVDPLVLYVRNSGQTSLAPASTTVLVDGQAATDVTFDVLESTDDTTWTPGQVAQITVAGLALPAGEHRARVLTEHGVESSLLFRVS